MRKILSVSDQMGRLSNLRSFVGARGGIFK
jgi:hypothetical protein